MNVDSAQRIAMNRFIGQTDEVFLEAVRTLHKAGESFPLDGAILDPKQEFIITDANIFAVRTAHGLIFVRDET